jgi:hypothetical protein
MLAVATWKAMGDLIVIGIDANEDVCQGDTARIFSEMALCEVILELHRHKPAPATCDKNNNCEPIEGLFASPGVRIVAGGYSSFNAGCPSDHRYLWIDIPYQDAFGYTSLPLLFPHQPAVLTVKIQQWSPSTIPKFLWICKVKAFSMHSKTLPTRLNLPVGRPYLSRNTIALTIGCTLSENR